jgi:DNA-binding NtrC family response regulator
MVKRQWNLQDNPVDLIVLDMIMDPGMDGLDTYREIIKLYPAQKAIIATGYCETERVKEAQKLGIGNCLVKPFTLEKLGKTVSAELKARNP